jgi:formamidopyrimidine-DNA glycosylase
MPELPELEAVREVLERRLQGDHIRRVWMAPKGGPIVVRDLTGRGFEAGLHGKQIAEISRRGKFLLVAFHADPLLLAVNFKLTGRFQLCLPSAKKAGQVHVLLQFEHTDLELRYIDRKRMGQLYLTEDLEAVPGFSEMGPEALEISRREFAKRLGSFHGEIKGILARERFIAGIGNAYADEILWVARIHPFRKRPGLTGEEISQLYDAMRKVLLQAIERVRPAMGEEIHLKPRDFFAVHMRGGEPCPRCGSMISAVTANRRITNFCRSCQPGGLIRGM